jgi:hypothetical protein
MFHKNSLALGLYACGLALMSACGAQNMRENSSELAAETAPAMTHKICNGDDINVRNTNMAVIGTANTGDRMGITNETKPSNGNTFRRVFFYDDPKGWGWVAVQYICKNDAGPSPTGARVIEVNLSTNRLKFFKGGTLVREWNVGTARAGKVTPTGNFKVLTKDVCPNYYGDGSKNIAGCSAENPLGTRALWFQGTIFGLHGTSKPELIAEGTSAADRRLSAGCIRNNNANIEWLFDQVQVGDAIIIK